MGLRSGGEDKTTSPPAARPPAGTKIGASNAISKGGRATLQAGRALTDARYLSAKSKTGKLPILNLGESRIAGRAILNRLRPWALSWGYCLVELAVWGRDGL